MTSQKEPWRLTASEALPLLRTGDLKVETYARSLLDRIQRRDAQVRAWVWLSPSFILQAAKALDDIPPADRGPLHGLPIGVKDVILTKDMPTQYNSPLFESEEPIQMDANVVMTLRAQGALIFGKTATTEFACSKQGNHHQNLCRNPHDATRTPGGSSSGSGAAVGDYQVPVAIGTQTGGSVVRPGSFNGCFGFKPTWGAISREGLGQWSPTLDTCGFFARSVRDLEVLAAALNLVPSPSSSSQPSRSFALQGAKIGFFRSPNWSHAGPGTRAAWEKAQEILRKHGAEISELEAPTPDFDNILSWHADILTGEGQASFLGHQHRAQLEGKPLGDDILRHLRNDRNLSPQQLLTAYDSLAQQRPAWDALAARHDLILTPSVVDEAPRGLEYTGDMSFCSAWTALHVPVVNLPGFQGESGLPVGLTGVGARFGEEKLLRVAGVVGEVFGVEGGWRAGNG